MNIRQPRPAMLAFLMPMAACLTWQSSAAAEAATRGSSGPNASYAGSWDLTVTTPTQEKSAWLKLSDGQHGLTGLLIGLWGHATPTPIQESKDGGIEFAVPGDEGFPEGTRFSGKLAGDELAGQVTAPDGAVWQWKGRRAPSLARDHEPKWGSPVSLFNGRDLAGWTFADPTQSGAWSVSGGALVKQGRGSEIVSIPKFGDFKLHIEFNCGPKANSGVYLRGRYEVQIETNAAQEPPNRRIGAVYGFIAPQPELPRKADAWQSYDITLIGRTVTVVHDDQTVIDHKEIPGSTGGALDSHEGSPGPIYLQGSEDGRVSFRNIVITPAQ